MSVRVPQGLSIAAAACTFLGFIMTVVESDSTTSGHVTGGVFSGFAVAGMVVFSFYKAGERMSNILLLVAAVLSVSFNSWASGTSIERWDAWHEVSALLPDGILKDYTLKAYRLHMTGFVFFGLSMILSVATSILMCCGLCNGNADNGRKTPVDDENMA
eukprot:Trichotokara_eunicae@DN1332_c0_g1_i1.p1